jgi:flagellar biosynthesis chaperone FliJ
MAEEDDKKALDGIVEMSERSVEERIRDFGEILEDIESMDDKMRRLWKEIYENAIADRQNSYVMFTKLVKMTKESSSEHAVHGKSIATYIERMQRANDQLVKLAELIADAKKKDESLNPDALFDQIKKRG